MEQTQKEIEWNSMKQVLMRLDGITNHINLNRARGDFRQMWGYLVDYFKEISGDLDNADRKEMWEHLKQVEKFLPGKNKPVNPWARVRLDEIDIKLRLLAKRHGYLTKTKKDISKAVFDF